MAIVKDYKKHGGRYTPRIKGKDQGVSRRRHACRPSVKVDRKTRVTIQEVIQTHGRRKVAALALSKSRGSENVRVDWRAAMN